MTYPSGKLSAISLTALRLLLAAWVGAAILFVITSIAEQTSPHFGSQVRDQLAVIRFPLYYRFGFSIHAAGVVLAILVWWTAQSGRKRFLYVLLLILASSILITLDYMFVYTPLEALVTPPGKARTQDFVRLHNWSRYANEFHLTVMAVAAVLAAVPVSEVEQRAQTDD